MRTLVLVPVVVLLVYCSVVCATLEDDEVVTASVFRRELNRARRAILGTIFKLFNPGYTASHPASSCKEILQQAPQSPSGLYWLRGTNNRPRQMYCDMERSCKGVAGGWMRVASIDMNDTGSTCPSGLRTLTSPRRLCRKSIDGQGCSSVVFPVQGIEYSQVCGKIIGYQFSSTDAFIRFPSILVLNNIESFYVDGISLTHGTSPREHIWTFASAGNEYTDEESKYACPCINYQYTPPSPVPEVVGNDYFCDTGSEGTFVPDFFYGDDPLWDGAGCGTLNTCCDWNSPPWFRKEISPPTSDDIEMRACADETNEDVYIESLEIYVQ